MAKRTRRKSPAAPAARAATRRPATPTLWLAAAVAALTLVVYWRATSFDFVTFDDNDYIYENQVVLHGLTAHGIRWAFGAHASNWHPLTWMSHMTDVSLFGPDPGRQHLVSIAIHAASSGLLLIALARLTGAVWPSAAVAALFALHPLHVESVAWLSERKDVLSGLFWNLSLLMYARFLGRRTRGAYAALVAAFAAGLLSKQMVVTLPFVLLLLDWWPLRRMTDTASFRSAFREKVPLIAMSAVASVVIFMVQRGTAVATLDLFPLHRRIENALLSYVRYLAQTFWPSSLAIFYPYPNAIPAMVVGGAAVILLAITVGAWIARDKAPYLLLGWLWYLGTLVPVIGIVQVGAQAHADRYTYLPLVGIFIAIAWSAAALVRERPVALRTAIALFAAVLVALSVVTWRQLEYWENGETLFTHAIDVTHNNPVAECDLGMALNLQGRYEDAVPHFERAVKLDPEFVNAWVNLGNALARMGNIGDAVKAWQKAIGINAALPDVHNNLGVAYMQAGRSAQAIAEFQRAVEIDPKFVPALLDLARVTAQSGDTAGARRYFQRVLEVDPQNREAIQALQML